MVRKTEVIVGLLSALLIFQEVQLSSAMATKAVENVSAPTTMKDEHSMSKSNQLSEKHEESSGKVDEPLVDENHPAKSSQSNSTNSTNQGEEPSTVGRFFTDEIQHAVNALTCSLGFCSNSTSSVQHSVNHSISSNTTENLDIKPTVATDVPASADKPQETAQSTTTTIAPSSSSTTTTTTTPESTITTTTPSSTTTTTTTTPSSTTTTTTTPSPSNQTTTVHQ